MLSGDATLRALNRQWRGIDRATDVLSFGYDESPDATTESVNGDLLISMARMRHQARRFRASPGEELARLVIHGTLHLAGFDHQRAAERRVMRAREEVALTKSRRLIRELDRRLGRTSGAASPA